MAGQKLGSDFKDFKNNLIAESKSPTAYKALASLKIFDAFLVF